MLRIVSKKDINADRKVNLDLPELVADLSLLMLRRFFKRRALKVAASIGLGTGTQHVD